MMTPVSTNENDRNEKKLGMLMAAGFNPTSSSVQATLA